MKRKNPKKYKFALVTAFYLAGMIGVLLFLFHYFFPEAEIWAIILFVMLCSIGSFFLIQHRIEKFIYKRVKKIYKDLRSLDETPIVPAPVTTDIEVLTQEVERFARDRRLEIETLKIRENYRKEYMGNISHELKTPLFTVQGYILTLLDGAHKDKTVRRKYLKNAGKGVERLIYIVQDLDMITKLEAGALHLVKEDFDLVLLLKNVFELLEMKSEKRNITLTLDKEYPEKIMVFADRERIQQVLTNLIVNSIKYGKQDGTTEVRIENLIRNKLLIRVTDNGEGIENQYLTRIFERFYRIDKSGSRREGGSGLGLSIVKHIVEAHSEKIYVESQFGIGSEFSFTLEKTK